jgi:VanZ family protein
MPSSSSHVRTPFRRAARIGAVVVWCAGIYLASDQPDLRVSSDDTLDFVLRKCGHMLVFGVLAALLWQLLRAERVGRRGAFAFAGLGTLAYAASDEWHQTFVVGRVGHPQDVAIDMVGAGLALAAIAYLTTRRTARKQAP